MLQGLVHILFMVWSTNMVNSSFTVDVYLKPFERTEYLVQSYNHLELKNDTEHFELHRVPSGGYFIYSMWSGAFFTVTDTVYGERLVLGRPGTVLTLGDADCVHDTLHSTKPLQLMVKGLSGCIRSENLLFTDPCNSSGWYVESLNNCTELIGLGCNVCSSFSETTCRECDSGLAVNGTTCAECPPGYEADICGQECVEITTTTEVPTTDTPKDPTFNPIEVYTTNFSDLDISGGGGGSGCCKPIGVFIMLASFLSWVVLI